MSKELKNYLHSRGIATTHSPYYHFPLPPTIVSGATNLYGKPCR